MKLTQQQHDILLEVRRRMNAPQECASEYICCNIDRVIAEEFDIVSVKDSVAAREKFEPFKQAMSEALNGYSTMFVYLRRTVPGFYDMSIVTQDEFTHRARLAWLDKIVETGRIE